MVDTDTDDSNNNVLPRCAKPTGLENIDANSDLNMNTEFFQGCQCTEIDYSDVEELLQKSRV